MRLERAEVVRPLPRVWSVGHGRGISRGSAGGRLSHGRSRPNITHAVGYGCQQRQICSPSDYRSGHGKRRAARYRVFRIRPCARRWRGAGFSNADSGRTGYRQVDIAVADAGNIARVVAGDSTFRGAGQRSAQQSGRAQGNASNTVPMRGNASSTHANTVLYISGEESQAQVRLRASRINAVEPNLLLASTTDLSTVLGLIEQNKPALAIVDSAQTIVSQEVDGISGGSTQVREAASALIDTAKTLDIPVFLVGHVTKDGSIAGPRTLEHLVDVVCQFEGDSETALRMLRAVKNRFGPTDEVGCFDMSGEGIEEVTDPAGLFLSGDGLMRPTRRR